MKTVALIFLLSSPVLANYYTIWGAAFDHPQPDSYTDSQQYELGYHQNCTKDFYREYGLGMWKDITHYPGVKTSPYVSFTFGLDIKAPSYHFVQYSLGPAFILYPDSVLGSHFQIEHKLGFGLYDSYSHKIGLYISHFSNAGLSKVNYGRNFIGLMVEF